MHATRAKSRIARLAVPTALAAAAAIGAVAGSGVTGLGAEAAAAAPAHSEHGVIVDAWQDTFTHQIHVTGFAYDGGAGQRSFAPIVDLYTGGRLVRTVKANGSSPVYDRDNHIGGGHRFAVAVPAAAGAKQVRMVVHATGRHNGSSSTDTAGVHQHAPTSEAIVHVARRYVGSRYSYGADGPHAFDCSGYSKFVYQRAHVATLPHNSQAQRGARRMRPIARSKARPGDLVFYLSDGNAYHVAIYAGHGMQYSATNPSRGVEHSTISSRHVVFKTDWH